VDTINVAICEDSPRDARRLEDLIARSAFEAPTTTFSRTDDFVRSYVPGLFDLVLMDIYMAGAGGEERPDGLGAVAAVRRVDPSVPVAFTTNSTDHALDGYRLDVGQYLLKPVQPDAVAAVLERAREAKRARPGITVRTGRRDVTVCPDQLVMAEQGGHYYTLVMADGRRLRVRGRLDQLEALLANPRFLRCHHSYLVNLAFVRDVDADTMTVALFGGCTAFVRRGWLTRTRAAWEDWLFEMAERKDGGRGW
jgi:DNA-binding LytR/AlgR family response regulator